MRVDFVTIFPDYFAPLDALAARQGARTRDCCEVGVHDLRDLDRRRAPHRRRHARTAAGRAWSCGPSPGGGRSTPLHGGRRSAAAADRARRRPAVPFTQARAEELASEPWLVFACGRYEGIDARVVDDAGGGCGSTRSASATTCWPGERWRRSSSSRRSHGCCPVCSATPSRWSTTRFAAGLLEAPAYTKPPTWRGRDVPAVLRPATTRRSRAGGASRRCGGPRSGARICSRRSNRHACQRPTGRSSRRRFGRTTGPVAD